MTARATQYVARQLKQLLATYVDGVTEETLNLQLLGGKLKLENISIRETALADLELPLRCSGRVGKLELTVNLLRFWWNEPVKIVLEDVELILEPLDQGEELCPSRLGAHLERIRLWKEGQVNGILQRDEDAGSRSTGFLARLAKKIRDNLEIHIKNFRVNVVDARSPDDGKAYKLELVLGSLVATSMDKKLPANDSPSSEESQKADTSKTEKVLAIHGFHAALMPYREHVEDLQGIARTAQADAEETLRQTYMAVEPVNLTLYLTIDDNHQLKVPQFLFRLDIDTAAIKFYKAQYCALYRIAAETSLYRGCLEHWYWRPRVPPLKDPRAWFRFAIKCVRSQVHHKRSAAKLGESYTFQYTRYLLAKNWLDSDQEALLRMENHFNAESLAKFRVAAKQMAQVQAAAAEAAKKVKAQESWGQWAKSFVASTVAETADLSDLDVEAQRILREAVEAAETADDDMEINAYPKHYARYRVDWSAKMGSLTLIDEGWMPESPSRELCMMQFHDLHGQYAIRRDSYRYSFNLASVTIDDRTNSVNGLSQIASCRPSSADSEGAIKQLLKWNWDTLPVSYNSETEEVFDSKDGGKMSVVVDGLNLVYSVESVLGIYNFFFVPKEDRFSRGDQKEAKEEQMVPEDDLAKELSLWFDRTRYDKQMQWQLSVLQPCILFPANAKDPTEPVLVFDLDRFLWGSELFEDESDDTVKYYDRMVMMVQNTRFRLVESIDRWLSCTANHKVAWMMEPITLAQDFDFQIVWDRCRLPENIRLAKDVPRNALSGTLPRVHFSVLAEQYCTFWYVFFRGGEISLGHTAGAGGRGCGAAASSPWLWYFADVSIQDA